MLKKTPLQNSILLIILIILLSSVVYSAPPVTQIVTNIGSNVLTIQYPKHDVYKFGTDPIKLHFHVFDSNSTEMKNDTTDCFIHIYDLDGSHIVERCLMSFDTNDHEWKFDLNTSIADHLGMYPYIVYCNNTQKGFLSTSFLITNSGLQYDVFNTWLVIIIALSVMTLSFGLSSFLIKSDKLESIKALFFLLFVITALLLGATTYLITLNPNNAESFLPVAITYLSVTVLVIIYFIYTYGLYLIRRLFEKRKKDKEKKEY